MPHERAVRHLAENLHSLTHPDGRPRRLMHLATTGRDDATQRHIQTMAHDIAQAAIHTLESDGYTITHRDDPKPVEPVHKTARLHCATCGKQLLRIALRPDNTAQLTRNGLTQLATIPLECPHDAATPT